MKNKFLLILFIIVLNIKPAFCIEEAVFLNTEEIFQLKTQEAVNLQRVNQDHESIIERNYNYFELNKIFLILLFLLQINILFFYVYFLQ